MVESAASVELEMKYYRPVFKAETVQRMLSGMIAALAFTSAHPPDVAVDALLEHLCRIAAGAASAQ